jgi:hypothetical protein
MVANDEPATLVASPRAVPRHFSNTAPLIGNRIAAVNLDRANTSIADELGTGAYVGA